MIYPFNKNRLPFIVVGTGRCGTVSCAKLLTAVGIPCGHEKIFGPRGMANKTNSDVSIECGLKNVQSIMADSSYMAVPFLKHTILIDAIIIHVVRNPIDVILSFHNKLQYWTSDNLNIWEKFISSHIPEIFNYKTPLEKNCYYVVKWNKWIQEQASKKYFRIRIEKDCEGLLKRLRIPTGLQPKFEVANSYENWKFKLPPLKNPATKEDILSCPLRENIKELAKEYGYEI